MLSRIRWFPQEKDSHMVIRSKYGLNPANWDSGWALRTPFCSPWKYILSQYDEFIKLVSFKVGNDGNI